MTISARLTTAACLIATLTAGPFLLVVGTGGIPHGAGAEKASPRDRKEPVAGEDPAATQAMQALAKISPRFERNMGQTDGKVEFISRGPGYAMFLSGSEAVFSTSENPDHALRMQLAGAAERPELVGAGRQKAKSNYLLGNDPGAWRTNIPNYSRVRARDVYPGIDVVYHGKRGTLEYDFVVKPGAHPRKIQMRFTGAETLEIGKNGDLLVSVGVGEFRQRRPEIYQTIDGKRRSVSGRFTLEDRLVGFRIGKYDPGLPLVIDPEVTFSTYLGGRIGTGAGAEDTGRAVAVDAAGNAYISGGSNSADFPIQADLTPPHRPTPGPCCDAYVAKIDPQGALVYSTYLGDPGEGGSEEAYGIDVDWEGNAYITGSAGGPTFPTTPNAYPAPCDAWKPFLVKLDQRGSRLLYSTCLQAISISQGVSVAVDKTGKAYVAGYTFETMTTKRAHQPDLGGSIDGFVAKFDPEALMGEDSLVFSTYVGGTAEDWANDVALDSSNRVYVTGFSDSPDLAPFPNPAESRGEAREAFIARYSTNGSLDRFLYLGGAGSDSGTSIAVGSDDSVHVSGVTDSEDFPQKLNPPELQRGGGLDAFLTRLKPDLDGPDPVVFSTYLGGSDEEQYVFGKTIALDSFDNVYLTGSTKSPDFPTKGAPSTLRFGGATDSFVTKIDLNQSPALLLFSTFFGGSSLDTAYGSAAIAVDALQSTVIASSTFSGDLPRGKHPRIREERGGVSDAYVAKLRAILPAIKRLDPTTGPVQGGTTVIVEGEHLSGAYKASFGDAPASSITPDPVTPDKKLVLVSPPHAAGSVDVRVTTPEGTSPISRPNDVFSYEPDLVPPGEGPSLAAIVPATGPVEGGQDVTVSGARFFGATEVQFGPHMIPASAFQEATESRIRFKTPSHPRSEVVPVRVRTARSLSNEAAYTYTEALPFATGAPQQATAPQPGGQPPSGGTTLGQRPFLSAPPTGTGPAPGAGTIQAAPFNAPVPHPGPGAAPLSGAAPGQAPSLVSSLVPASQTSAMPGPGVGVTPEPLDEADAVPGIHRMVAISGRDSVAYTLSLSGGLVLMTCTMGVRRRHLSRRSNPAPSCALAYSL